MDRNTLNNKIVLCRFTVRKARVIVIRKILKKMKILRSCKNENEKEKKFIKAEKLYSKIQIMKKLKDDEVTKFALLNEDYDVFLKNAAQNMKNAALASLAKYKEIQKFVSEIRSDIPNWKSELPLLLCKKKKLGKKVFKRKCEYSNNSNKLKIDVNTSNVNAQQKLNVKIKKVNDENHVNSKNEDVSIKGHDDIDVKFKSNNDEHKCITKSKTSRKVNFVGSEIAIDEKIDDPFFIGKKIISPKLVTHESEKEIKNCIAHEVNKHTFVKNSYNINTTNLWKVGHKNEKCYDLHPSWAAKKFVTMIKPFEGKKTKFPD